ncbi:hypothetical protein BDZ91DRAFT_176773 [Kalaharituber pfeilii]|nr:hypothetical protein BDZ91DRAFT_176773 [Kalaharituber pfeilii]
MDGWMYVPFPLTPVDRDLCGICWFLFFSYITITQDPPILSPAHSRDPRSGPGYTAPSSLHSAIVVTKSYDYPKPPLPTARQTAYPAVRYTTPH